MELLIALVLVAIIGVLAQAGTDSRDADTRTIQTAW
jgi:Tfp pilus assembly protein FimT